jgi:hypothetical protein
MLVLKIFTRFFIGIFNIFTKPHRRAKFIFLGVLILIDYIIYTTGFIYKLGMPGYLFYIGAIPVYFVILGSSNGHKRNNLTNMINKFSQNK